MQTGIDQFMWGYQQHFRMAVQREVSRILSSIGLLSDEKATVLLVGFAARDGLRHAICVEPEYGPLTQDDLKPVEGRTTNLMQVDPQAQVFHSNPGVHASRRRGLFLRSRARAISEAIQHSRKFEGATFTVSSSTDIGGYDVHTCIGLPTSIMERVSRFSNPMREDIIYGNIEESFAEATVNTLLQRCDQALYFPDPGVEFQLLGSPIDVIRTTAERFLRGVATALNPTALQPDLFSVVTSFSSQTYERIGARGYLAITKPDNLTNKLRVAFQSPIALTEIRAVRKVLELTDEDRVLLSDGQSIFGIGHCDPAPDVARIVVEGHATWALSIDNATLMGVDHEHASLPGQLLDKSVVKDIVERTVGNVEFERIWEVIQAAINSGHGTTIVVSSDAMGEAERLSRQGVPIKPDYLNREDARRLGRVDGAIILGTDGRCYAFGVILDGLATSSSGDRARGARFNSSVRYQQTSDPKPVVIVISDDGTVDVVPQLMPRVRREDVEETVQLYYENSGKEGSIPELWARLNDVVQHYAFYLNQDQCERVNRAYEAEWDLRFKHGNIRMTRKPLAPNPNMDDSYFLTG